jgi:hypothetical protein
MAELNIELLAQMLEQQQQQPISSPANTYTPGAVQMPEFNSSAFGNNTGSLDNFTSSMDPNAIPGRGQLSGVSVGQGMDSNFGVDLSGLGSILQGGAGLASAWAGLQGVKLGKKQLDFTKGVTNRNIYNQSQSLNTQLADTHQRKIASSGGGTYQSVDKYMNKNKVDGSPV